jgi:hypothetical protein
VVLPSIHQPMEGAQPQADRLHRRLLRLRDREYRCRASRHNLPPFGERLSCRPGPTARGRLSLLDQPQKVPALVYADDQSAIAVVLRPMA